MTSNDLALTCDTKQSWSLMVSMRYVSSIMLRLRYDTSSFR